MFLFFFSYAGFIYVYIFKKCDSFRHSGLIIILLYFILWLYHYYQENRAASTTRLLKTDITYGALLLFIGVGLLYSVYYGMKAHVHEWHYSFSGSKDAATYIKANKLDSYTIIAHYSPQASSLLPYLSGKKFWYPYLEDYGTFLRFDEIYKKSRAITHDEMMRRVQKKFGPTPSVLFLLTEPLDQQKFPDFSRIYTSRGKPNDQVYHPDEFFYIYKRKEASENPRHDLPAAVIK